MSTPTSSPGRTIGGRYRLDASVGRGGMGTVWEAFDEVLRRRVAVKEVLLPPGIPAEERDMLCERTLREARSAAKLTHPSVIRVYDVVEEDNRPWIVMELLDAKSIADLLREHGPMPADMVASVGIQVLGALDAAHAAGILHRDIKPGNVLVARDGRTTLTDFGVARAPGDSALTSTGLLLGSPSYISPERARGGEPTPAADLWGLGATLYAAVEGRAPFERGDPLPTLTAVVGEPPDPMQRAGALTPVLEGLLAKDPDRRWDTDRTRTGLQAALSGQAPVVQEQPRLLVGGRSDVVTAAGSGALAAFFDEHTATGEQPVRPQPTPGRHAVDAGPEPMDLAPTDRRAVGYAEDDPEERRGGHRGLIALALVVALVVVAGGAYLITRAVTAGPTNGDRAQPSASAPAASTSPSASASPSAAASFVDYTGNGFSVDRPSGWTERASTSGTTDFVDPAGGRFVRFGTSTSGVDAVTLLTQGEKSFSRQQSTADYQRVQLTRAQVSGNDGAVWEFTYQDTSGTQRHVKYETFIKAGTAYEIYLSTTQAQWSGSQNILAMALKTFQVTG